MIVVDRSCLFLASSVSLTREKGASTLSMIIDPAGGY